MKAVVAYLVQPTVCRDNLIFFILSKQQVQRYIEVSFCE